MKQHTEIDVAALQRGIDTIKRSTLGKYIGGNLEFTEDLTFQDIVTTVSDVSTFALLQADRIQKALKRDAMYGAASAQWHIAFGRTQAMREVYGMGKSIIDSGGK